jgi:2,5-diamino-6-(ribosylamino)-4(3H)-pyrimidinone 5'-phosphate reductase
MLPKVIMFNSISLDGALRDFEIDVGLHYRIAGQFKADVHLVGSETARTGIEMFSAEVPKEEASDRIKPEILSDDKRPYWAIIDSRGILMNFLHAFRNSGFGKDVIVFVAENTSAYYKDYLAERQYDCHIVGENRVDLRGTLEILAGRYGAKTVLTDAGTSLNSVLLENGLVDEINLLISPILVGKDALKLFEKLDLCGAPVKCELLDSEDFENSHILLKYKVTK